MLPTSPSVISDWELVSDPAFSYEPASGPKPLLLPSHANSLQQSPLRYGGLPLPKPRATPPSLHLTTDCTRDSSTVVLGSPGKSVLAWAPSTPLKKVRLSAPTCTQAGSISDSLLRVKQPSGCRVIQKLWDELVGVLLPFSQLLHDVEHSVHRDHHVSRILDNFAATTLSKYIPAIIHFVEACRSLRIDLTSLTAVQMADGLIAVRLARSSDGVYMNSATIIKALRWSVKQLGADCFQCAFDGLISKFLSDKIPRDVRESLPLPLYCFMQWERKILISSTDPFLIIILGSFLFQAWTGLRWADMQRVNPINLIFDFDTIRGIAWRTKTTTRGQAFGCVTSGFLSRGSHTWALVYLRTLDQIFGPHGNPQLDFLVPRLTGDWRQLRLVQPPAQPPV